MKIEAYIVYANLYLVFFWVFYRVFLHRGSYYRSARMYMLSTGLLALILPLVQVRTASWIPIPADLYPGLEKLDMPYIFRDVSLSSPAGNEAVRTPGIFSLVLLSGSFASLCWFLCQHLKITLLIQNSVKTGFNHLNVIYSKKFSLPFIYRNSIVLPESLRNSGSGLILMHESMHHHLGHHRDILLFQLYQVIFWMNPVMYLLRNELRQVHEFQVDKKILATGTDPSEYKLTLIRFSAGTYKFSLASSLTSKKLKTRFIMMNRKSHRKHAWALLLLVPILSTFSLFLGCMDKPEFQNEMTTMGNTESEEHAVQGTVPDPGTLPVVHVINNITEDQIIQYRGYWIPVLMNKKDQLLFMSKEKITFDQVHEKVVSEFRTRLKSEYPDMESDLSSSIENKPMILFERSVNSSREAYNKVIGELFLAVDRLKNAYSNDFFSKDYLHLDQEQRSWIDSLIPGIYCPPVREI